MRQKWKICVYWRAYNVRDQNFPSFLGFPSFSQLSEPHYAIYAGNSRLCHKLFLVFGENPFWSLNILLLISRGNWSIKGRKSHKMELIYSLALEEEGSLSKPDVPYVQIIRSWLITLLRYLPVISLVFLPLNMSQIPNKESRPYLTTLIKYHLITVHLVCLVGILDPQVVPWEQKLPL